MKLFKIILGISLGIFCFVPIYSQTIISSPFNNIRNENFEPEPYISLNNSMALEGNKSSKPLYLKSYLFEDPQQAWVRVIKMLRLNNNPPLTHNVEVSYWEKKENNWKINIENINPNYPAIHPQPNFKTELSYSIRQFVGANWNEIKTMPAAYFQNLSWYQPETLPEIEKNIALGYLSIDSLGMIQTGKRFVPEEFAMDDFYTIIMDAIIDGNLSSYYSSNFKEEIPTLESIGILRNNKTQISGYRIVEDYYINPINNEVSSTILGVGIVANVNHPEKELMWISFDELRYQLEAYCMYLNHDIYNFELFFDNHLGNSVVESIERMGNEDNTLNDYSYSVQLDPLVSLQLDVETNRSIPNKFTDNRLTDGKILDFQLNSNNRVEGQFVKNYANNQIEFQGQLVDGKCEGEWRYYFSTGKLKAIRNFNHGMLDGLQYNYYSNDTLYALYEYKNGLIQNLKRYYDDGSPLDQGDFKNGVVIGLWNYRIKCTNETYRALKETQTRG